MQSTTREASVKPGQVLPQAPGYALVRCALCLLMLVSTTACGTLGVGIEPTPVPERTATALATTGEPTYLARQTPAQPSATPIGTTAPEEPTNQATARPTPRPATETQDGIPDRCRVEGHELYVNTEDGYCFSYPPGFTLGEFSPGQPAIFGPPLDQSIEPLAAMLGIEVKPVPADSDLSDLVDAFVAEFANLPLPSITRSSFELGGEPAELLEVVPGREGSRDVIAIHGGALYHLLFMPSVKDFPQAQPDVEALFEAVTTSFSFLE